MSEVRIELGVAIVVRDAQGSLDQIRDLIMPKRRQWPDMEVIIDGKRYEVAGVSYLGSYLKS